MIHREILGSNIERLYWLTVIASLTGFAIDQETSKLNTFGYYEWRFQDHNYYLWVALVFSFSTISGVIAVTRIAHRRLRNLPVKSVGLHAFLAVCCVCVLININQVRIAIGYFHSIYYARNSAPCKERANKTHAYSICYRIINDPYESAIVIDPSHDMRANVQYLGNIPSVATALREQGATSLGNGWFSSIRLRDDIYFISTSYF